MNEHRIDTDIAVIGASLGGVQAALSALLGGKRVVLTNSCTWIGGQLTSQAVPPDEHQWIEQIGCTHRYRQYREAVRDYYRKTYPDINDFTQPIFDPGNSLASRLAHEPAVAHTLLYAMLQPYITEGRCVILTGYRPLSSIYEHHSIYSVRVCPVNTQSVHTKTAAKPDIDIHAQFFIDGSDTGELLPLVEAEYVLGAEAKSETGESSASLAADTEDLQPITWVAALGRNAGIRPIEKPVYYDFFRRLRFSFGSKNLVLSMYGHNDREEDKAGFSLYEEKGKFSLWNYRRVFDPRFDEAGSANTAADNSEISLLNWPQNDYLWSSRDNDGLSTDHWYMAQQLTLSVVYWLQTEADNGGYPELGLRTDILGTDNGLAQEPYVREGRRIRALQQIVEEDVSAAVSRQIRTCNDSIGVGAYPIDMHPTAKTFRMLYAPVVPFQIPLGALIPIRMSNLLPASKNIGTTHITNGCFRLHPIEWNVGEAAGYLASWCIDKAVTPKQLHENKRMLRAFQGFLEDQGVQLAWDTAIIGSSPIAA